MKVLILAGGSGTRLWPLSTNKRPKQFLELSSDGSLLQKTLMRALRLTDPSDIVVVTSEKYVKTTKEHISSICPEGGPLIATEPEAKNTAAAIGLGLSLMREQALIAKDDLILVLSADHEIFPEEKFVERVTAAKAAAQKGSIVCFGAQPTHPETGYGYLNLGPDSGAAHPGCFGCTFVEKPTKEKAEAFLKTGHYLWNCGIFLFSFTTILDAFQKYLPQTASLLSLGYIEAKNVFSNLPSVSIDYGIMEKSDAICAMPLEDVVWSDVGTFDALYTAARKDINGNVVYGDVDLTDAKNCFVKTAGKPVALLGVENLHVIDTQGALLIAAHGESQRVKEVAGKVEVQEPEYETQKHALESNELKSFGHSDMCIHLLIISGLAEVKQSGKCEKLMAGGALSIRPGQTVEISNQSSYALEIIEVRYSAHERAAVGLL
jgi:mannose-1-phosphate guanylyltransferase / mannose-6-phosphate isomerase